MSHAEKTTVRWYSKNHFLTWFSGKILTCWMLGIVLALTSQDNFLSAQISFETAKIEQKPLLRAAFCENLDWLNHDRIEHPRSISSSKTVTAESRLTWPWLPRAAESPSQAYLRLVDDSGDKPDKKDDETTDTKGDDKSDQKAPPEPDISKPGADFGDYPNSAYTLPKGRSYLEIAPFTYLGKDRHNSASYSYNYLFRYGVTDDVEFRLTGSGLTTVFDPGSAVVGFAPLIIDTKIHLWDDQIDKLIPAMSFEAFLQTNLASPTFQSGFQPSINLNMDFPFTKDTNVEMTVGYSGVQDAVAVIGGERFVPRLGHKIPMLSKANLNVNQLSFQWALEQQVTEKFQVFLQGYYNGDVFRQSAQGRVIGIGYFYQFNKRATFYNSYNGGLDPSTPNFSSQVGFAFAY